MRKYYTRIGRHNIAGTNEKHIAYDDFGNRYHLHVTVDQNFNGALQFRGDFAG